MKHNITSKSSLRVVLRDKIENYSKEAITNIKNRAKHKYGVSSVRVDFQATNKLNIGLTNFDTNDVENINRPETQEKIILQYISDNDLDITIEDIKRLNKKVETSLIGFSEAKDNRWKIKNLTIENFLSYKDKVVLNFENLKGLTLIQGDNYAGKTSLIIDSVRFLLFNTTSKTTTADQVINHFINPDFARVEGELVIDNIDYKIERKVERTWKKDKSSYKTSTILNFYERNDLGEYELINGEKRQSTDKILRENIGNENEFLMTVLCTGRNLFDMIEAKTTDRGKLLTKFLGLEIFEQKEDVSKKMYSEWKLKSKIDKYSSSELQNVIEKNEDIVQLTSLGLNSLKVDLATIQGEKLQLVSEKEDILKLYYRDIDHSMVNLTQNYFIEKIEKLKITVVSKKNDLDINNKLISKEKLRFDSEKHSSLKLQVQNLKNKIFSGEIELKNLRNTITQLKNGENCPTCGQSLKDVDHTVEIKEKTEKGVKLKGEIDDFKNTLINLEPEILSLEKVKEQISEQDFILLKQDKIEVEIESLNMKISKEEDNLRKFIQDLDKIDKNKALDVEVRRKEIQLSEVTNKEYQKNREIQNLENTISNAQKTISENEVLIDTIKKEEHIAKVFTIYINMMGKNGISKTIIKNTVPILNLELIKLLSDSAEFTVSIEVNDKNNDVEFWMVDNETEIKKPLSSGSGYETFIGALALRIVNSKVNTLPKPSLLLLDEVFGTVAQNNFEKVKDFIDKIIVEIDNVFIITHNEIVKEWADNIITVIKSNKVSTVH